MAELKKCPFCGGEAKLNYVGTCIPLYFVSCEECGCKQESSIHKEAVINSWNNRATEAEIRAKAEHTYENCHNITCRRKCQKDGYNMAIDEFAEKLKPIYKGITIAEKVIDEIAEQLKGE